MRQSQALSATPAEPSSLGGHEHTNGIADALVARHFLMQHARPAELADVRLEELAPDLRTLLFTDGTVTRALEAGALRRVAVEVVEERASRVPVELAECVDLPPGAAACQRRVTISSRGGSAPLVYAESLIVVDRLPAGFLALLTGSRQGIGEAISAGRLESRRELLWFGLSAVPPWQFPSPSRLPALVRAYRVMVDERPTMLICESFVVQRGSRQYTLCG